MGEKPCIRGMRVTVGMIVGMIAAACSSDDILKRSLIFLLRKAGILFYD
jgi:hypothetical protein